MNLSTDPQLNNSEDEAAKIKIPVLQQLALLAVVLLLIFGTGITSTLLMFLKKDASTPVVTETVETVIEETEIDDTPAFTNTSITGKAAYIWDVANQHAVYKKNEADQLPLASLTKLMTALVAHELLHSDDTITISQTAISQDGISGLTAGETFDLLSLNDLTLISSSNDGAYALAYAAGAVLAKNDPANAFVQAMNIRAEEIGLTETYFKNPTGLDISTTEGGAYGTARDMAFLMEYIIKNEPAILAYTKEKETDITNVSGGLHESENTNYYVDEIPGLIGSKTGYTDLAGGNLVIAFDAGLNRPFVISVLGSTRHERFTDVMTLVEEVQQYLNEEQGQ